MTLRFEGRALPFLRLPLARYHGQRRAVSGNVGGSAGGCGRADNGGRVRCLLLMLFFASPSTFSSRRAPANFEMEEPRRSGHSRIARGLENGATARNLGSASVPSSVASEMRGRPQGSVRTIRTCGSARYGISVCLFARGGAVLERSWSPTSAKACAYGIFETIRPATVI